MGLLGLFQILQRLSYSSSVVASSCYASVNWGTYNFDFDYCHDRSLTKVRITSLGFWWWWRWQRLNLRVPLGKKVTLSVSISLTSLLYSPRIGSFLPFSIFHSLLSWQGAKRSWNLLFCSNSVWNLSNVSKNKKSFKKKTRLQFCISGSAIESAPKHTYLAYADSIWKLETHVLFFRTVSLNNFFLFEIWPNFVQP